MRRHSRVHRGALSGADTYPGGGTRGEHDAANFGVPILPALPERPSQRPLFVCAPPAAVASDERVSDVRATRSARGWGLQEGGKPDPCPPARVDGESFTARVVVEGVLWRDPNSRDDVLIPDELLSLTAAV